MEHVFDITDKTGRKIHLSKERWEHITTIHSEISNYLGEIEQIIKNPLKITTHTKGDLRNYYLYLKHRKNPEKYLKVIVKYLNEHGFVITAHFVKYIK
jgi:hypothetical protein